MRVLVPLLEFNHHAKGKKEIHQRWPINRHEFYLLINSSRFSQKSFASIGLIRKRQLFADVQQMRICQLMLSISAFSARSVPVTTIPKKRIRYSHLELRTRGRRR